jgi:D-sedoheptulose 7-phosphate isomerase
MVDKREPEAVRLVESIRHRIQNSVDAKRVFADGAMPLVLAEMAGVAATAIETGGKLMFCGNGGSAADAQHLAAECLVRLRSTHNRDALPAMTLATDTSTLTACANDYSFDEIFSRTLSGLGRSGDVVIGITTSGKSKNVIRAFEVARNMGIVTVGFLGTGGPALPLCDYALVAPSDVTGVVQELHIMAGHILVELIEDILLSRGAITLNGPTL